MKAKNDHFTTEMFSKRPPGRPRKVGAMTVAERVRKHRAAKKLVSVTCNGNCSNGNPVPCSGICRIGQLG